MLFTGLHEIYGTNPILVELPLQRAYIKNEFDEITLNDDSALW